MKLLLIDGSNLIFRAYYATEKQNIVSKDGIPLNAISTLVSMINKLISEHKPTHVFIAQDSGKSTFRHDMYSDYKGKRSETPDRLKMQFSIADELYTAMGISAHYTEKFEADDLIATYAKQAKDNGYEVVVVSGDKDLLQLVDDNVNVITPAMGFAKEVNYSPKKFVEKFSFSPDRFIEYKALVGDKSDNIIGIDGLGDKTATKMILEYSNIEEIIKVAQSGEKKTKVWKNLAENPTQIYENIDLVTLIDHVTTEKDLEDFKFEKFNSDTFLNFLHKYGLTKLYNQFSKNIEKKESNIKITEIKTLEKITDNETFILPIYGKSKNYIENPILGIGLLNDENYFIYNLENGIDFLQELLVKDCTKIVYDLKCLLVSAKSFEYKNVRSDIHLAASLVSSNNFKKDIENIGFEYQVSLEHNLTQKVSKFSEIEFDNIASLLKILKNLYIPIQNDIELLELEDVLVNMEIPLSKVIGKMEFEGVNVDLNQLNVLLKEYDKKLKKIEEKLSTAGEFNFASPKQLSNYLFEEKKLPTKGLKKNNNGYSTDVNALNKVLKQIKDIEEYEFEYTFIINLLEYRKYNKIRSTYLEGILKYVSDDKVHPITHQLFAETGRLSCTDPNIQNIPIRSDEGRVIRSLFNSGKEKYFISIDYSQVELRIIAHMANEEQMINDFNQGLDIHTETAKKIFHIDEVTSTKRSQAKAINFGIIYGMSPYGLAKQVGISNEEAVEFINRYFKTYPKIKQFMQDQIVYAKKFGQVKTHFGRVRKINDINSNSKMLMESASRMAINTPIQGTAADIIKLAMIEIDKYLEKNDDIKMSMQIHDELVFYTSNLEHIEQLKEIMENVVDFKVKLKVEATYGKNWLECK